MIDYNEEIWQEALKLAKMTKISPLKAYKLLKEKEERLKRNVKKTDS